jgi:hypothetical protein
MSVIEIKPRPFLSRDRRIAIAEDMRIVGRLTEINSPHAKELAAMVLERIRCIVEEKAPIGIVTDDDVANMLALARAVEEEG